MTLKFRGRPWETIEPLFSVTSSFVQHIGAICEFKLELRSGNPKFGSNSVIFCPLWPWNLTDDIEKRQGIYPILHQALCILSSPYVNSNWSYSPETANLGFDLFVTLTVDLLPWPFVWTSLLSMVITPEYFMMIRCDEHCKKVWRKDGRTGRRTGRQTERAIEQLGRS